MIACYDLARCPPTYDAVAFLALAELERVRRRDDHIDIVVLPGPCGGFRRDNLWPHGLEERQQVRDRVLVPLCRLLPSVRSVEVADDRSAEGWGKGEYHVGLPAIVGALREGSRPLRSKSNWPERQPRMVTLTLREADHHPLRNSRTVEWLAAAHELRRRGTVVVVRDARCAFEKLSDLLEAPSASLDIDRRADLYSQAALNVGISNGPMWMSIFMDAPTLMLRPTTNAAGGCYDDYFYKKHGVPPGSQLPNSPPHQRLVWQEDTCENIVRAVEEMLG